MAQPTATSAPFNPSTEFQNMLHTLQSRFHHHLSERPSPWKAGAFADAVTPTTPALVTLNLLVDSDDITPQEKEHYELEAWRGALAKLAVLEDEGLLVRMKEGRFFEDAKMITAGMTRFFGEREDECGEWKEREAEKGDGVKDEEGDGMKVEKKDDDDEKDEKKAKKEDDDDNDVTKGKQEDKGDDEDFGAAFAENIQKKGFK